MKVLKCLFFVVLFMLVVQFYLSINSMNDEGLAKITRNIKNEVFWHKRNKFQEAIEKMKEPEPDLDLGVNKNYYQNRQKVSFFTDQKMLPFMLILKCTFLLPAATEKLPFEEFNDLPNASKDGAKKAENR